MHDENQGSTFASFFRAIPKSFLAEILAAGLALEILALSIPIFSQVILDKVVVHNSANTLHVLAAGMLIAVCFEGVLSYLYVRHVGLFTDSVDRKLTGNVIEQLFRLPLSYFERFSKGELMNRLREIAEVRNFLSTISITAVIDLVFSLFVLLIISAYSAKLALVVLASIPVLAAFSLIVRPIVRRRFAVMHKASENFNAAVAEGVQKIVTIKSLGLEGFWHQRWLDAHQRVVAAGLEARGTSAVEEAAFRIIHRAVLVAVLWFGATEVLSGALSFGQFVASYMFSLRVLGPSTRIFQVVLDFQRIREARQHIDTLMAERIEVFGNQSPPPADGNTSIDLRSVTFTYPSAMAPALHGVDLSIASGSMVAIIGRSGSGKSTIARIIQAHCVPQMGSVLLGGIHLVNLCRDDLRKKIHLLTQDSALFRGTVRSNIVADSPIDEERLRHACDVSEASQFIAQMPQGLLAKIDESASQLSAGQRQRIALARAVYAQPSFLLLDEATNALDLETELLVMRRVRAALPHATIVLITHRQHVLGEVDGVFTVNDGRVTSASAATARQELVHAAA